MKHLVIVLTLLVAFGAVAEATPTPFLSIDDGTSTRIDTNPTAWIRLYGGHDTWVQTSLNPFTMTSQQIPSSYSWLLENHWYCVDLNEANVPEPIAWDFYDTATLDEPFGKPSGQGYIYGSIAGLRRAAWLLDTYHGDVSSSPTRRAALQLAIWEAVYDNDLVLDLGDGLFMASASEGGSPLTGAVVDFAVEYYEASYGRSGRGVYAVDGQNLLGRTEIPEPGTLILLGIVILAGGIGAVRRRSSR